MSKSSRVFSWLIKLKFSHIVNCWFVFKITMITLSSSLPHFKPHLFTSSFLKDTDSLSTYRKLFYYVLTHSRWSINTGWNHSYAFQVHSLPDTSFFLQVLAIIPPRLCFIYRDRTTKQRLKTGTWNGTVFSLQQNLFKHCKRE